ncbi:UNVERIFIED_CONTAM: hypothetical protein GTU68_060535 [Idotea baltica]|nr:hypothetical protein [Idotea baltica]
MITDMLSLISNLPMLIIWQSANLFSFHGIPILLLSNKDSFMEQLNKTLRNILISTPKTLTYPQRMKYLIDYT